VRRIVEKMELDGVKVGGMTSGDLRSESARVGFEIRNLMTDEVGVLAHVSQSTGPRIGKYRVNSESLDKTGTAAICSAFKDADLIVIDEVGPMELTSARFRNAVRGALDCGKPVLGTVHRNAQDPLVKEIKSGKGVEVVEVTHENRDRLVDILAQRFKTT